MNDPIWGPDQCHDEAEDRGQGDHRIDRGAHKGLEHRVHFVFREIEPRPDSCEISLHLSSQPDDVVFERVDVASGGQLAGEAVMF